MKELKKKVSELVDIAKACPENLQVVCFEVLLKNHLQSQEQDKLAIKPSPGAVVEPNLSRNDEGQGEVTKQQEDLVKAGIHVKAKKLLDKYSLTMEQINNLFYKEGADILPLYEDLKTTRISESQIRIALLQCLRSALENGEFSCEVESVRQECNARKCYDSTNFRTHFKNNAEMFDFKNFTKSVKTIKLSVKGQKELGEVIKELQ